MIQLRHRAAIGGSALQRAYTENGTVQWGVARRECSGYNMIVAAVKDAAEHLKLRQG